jgi:hypothetical protein
MMRIGDITVELETAADVVFSQQLEVSLDCHVCRRCKRTIVFEVGKQWSRCTPTGHAFPGRIVAKETQRVGDLHLVRYSVLYEYEYFVDAKHPWPPGPSLRERFDSRKPTGEPTWARVHFTIACPNCGVTKEKSTQNNLGRPWPIKCDCGHVLYMEIKEMPILSSRDVERP